MTTSFFDEIKQLLPLSLEFAFYKNNMLNFGGKQWSFSTHSAWRFRDKSKLLFGCDDNDIEQRLDDITSSQIVSVGVQSANLPIDPVFIFSKRFCLEIFSSKIQRSWVFHFPDGKIFIGSPGIGACFEGLTD